MAQINFSQEKICYVLDKLFSENIFLSILIVQINKRGRELLKLEIKYWSQNIRKFFFKFSSPVLVWTSFSSFLQLSLFFCLKFI